MRLQAEEQLDALLVQAVPLMEEEDRIETVRSLRVAAGYEDMDKDDRVVTITMDEFVDEIKRGIYR